MKTIICSLALASMGLSRELNLGITSRMINNQFGYQLSCNNSQGSVQYFIEGLPNGVIFKGSSIIVTNQAKVGFYTIKIKVIDESGLTSEKNITLSVPRTVAQITYQQDSKFASQNGKIESNENKNNNNSSTSKIINLDLGTGSIGQNSNGNGNLSNISNSNLNQIRTVTTSVKQTGASNSSRNQPILRQTMYQANISQQQSQNINIGQTSNLITSSIININNNDSINSAIINSGFSQLSASPSILTSSITSGPNQLIDILSRDFRSPATTSSTSNLLISQQPNINRNDGPTQPNNYIANNGDPKYSNYPSQSNNNNLNNQNRYPQPNLPTGADPNQYNFTPQILSSSKSTPNQSNRNSITPDDVTLRAASDRHQNAIKSITNLLRIIDQARANRDKALKDVQTYTFVYNDAVETQRLAQNSIIAAQNKSKQIISAINTIGLAIDDLKNKIAESTSIRDALNKQKITITSTISVLESSKSSLLEKLKTLDDQVDDKFKKLTDKNSQIQKNTNEISKKRSQIAKVQQDLSNIDTLRQNAIADLNDKNTIVNDLKRRIQKAEKDYSDAKAKLSDIQLKKKSLPTQLVNLNKQLQQLKLKAKQYTDDLLKIQASIDNVKNDYYQGLINQINNADKKISTYKSRIFDIQTQLKASSKPLQDLKFELSQALQDMQFIKNQKVDSDSTLKTAYQRGNDFNNKVAFSKQNVDAVVKRFQDQSKVVKDATLNLEKARAEQALARQGLQQLIAHYSDALPYSIVPNGNNVPSNDTPYGNNPSGSPFGPVNQNGNGAPGSFKINNWVSYLSSAYGAGISPAYFGSVNQLFPFNFLSITTGNMSQNTNIVNNYGNIRSNGNTQNSFSMNGQCQKTINGGSSDQQSESGIIVNVNNDSFDMRTNNGQNYTVKVLPCTALNANKSNYIMKNGHQAIVRGYSEVSARNTLKAQQITCIL